MVACSDRRFMTDTAFIDRAAGVRPIDFAQDGLPVAGLSPLRRGPVVAEETVDDRKEANPPDLIEELPGLAKPARDASRRPREATVRPGRALCARIRFTGVRLALGTCGMPARSAGRRAALQRLGRTDDPKSPCGAVRCASREGMCPIDRHAARHPHCSPDRAWDRLELINNAPTARPAQFAARFRSGCQTRLVSSRKR